MAHVIHDSFKEIAEADFKTYVDGLLEAHPTQSEKKQAISYLQQVLSSDKSALDVEQKALFVRRALLSKQQKATDAVQASHSFDFAKTPTLFQNQNPTDGQIATLLTSNDVDVRIGTKVLTTAIVMSGSRTSLVGTGASGLATDGTLKIYELNRNDQNQRFQDEALRAYRSPP